MSDPKGVVAIWISPDGHVIATKADFERQSFGGFKLHVAQAMRAEKFVQWAAVKAYSSPAMADCLGGYLLEQIAAELRRKGHRVVLRAIGYDDKAAEVVEHRGDMR